MLDEAIDTLDLDTLPPPPEPPEAESATRQAIDRAKAGELLTGKELAAVFRIKHTQFAQLREAGAFDSFKCKPAIGLKCYSGIKVYRYLCGDPVYEPTFGRKRGGKKK